MKMKLHFKTIQTSSTILLLAVFGMFTAFTTLQAATVTAKATGLWSATSTWDTGTVPTSADDVVIPDTYTVTVDASAKVCKNITVNGVLTSSAVLTSPFYLRIYGTTLTVNSTGSIPITGLSVELYGTALTITGTGSINLCRVRPTLASSTLTIDADMTLNYVGGGFYANGKDAITLTVNPSKTLTTAVGCYLSPTASTSSDANPAVDFTINVNGTVVLGSPSGANSTNLSLRSGAGKTGTLNVGSTGTLNINGNLFAPAATGGNAVVSVSAGGKINFTGSGTAAGQCDISKATTTIAGTLDLFNQSQSIGSATNGRSLGTATITSTGTLRLQDAAFPPQGIGTGTATLSPGSTVEYYGATSLGTTPTTYENLVINTSTGSASLASSITVNGTMTMTIGKLLLGNYDLTLNGSLVGASGSNKYFVTNGTGSLIKNNIFVPTLFQIGVSETSYDPFGVVPSGSSSFKARVSETITNPVSNPTLIVQREWTIDRTSGSGTVTMTLQHDASAPLNSFNGANPVSVSHWTGSTYEQLAASYSSNTFALAAVSSFANAFIGGNAASIPVEMITFKGYTKGAVNILNWSTASERNNREFVIERSLNGHDYQTIGSVKGNGNSAVVQNYNFTDDAAPLSIAYYRLRQIDFDGKENVSKAITLARSGNAKAGLEKIYPSVTSDVLTIEMTTNGNTTLTITDLLGRVVSTKQLGDNTGFIAQRIDVSSLAKGLYFINFQSGSTRITEKFEKQ